MRKKVKGNSKDHYRNKFYEDLSNNYSSTRALETGKKSSKKEIDKKLFNIKKEIGKSKDSYFRGLNSVIIPKEKVLSSKHFSKNDSSVLKKLFHSSILKKAKMAYVPKSKMLLIPSDILDKYKAGNIGTLSHELRHHAQNIGRVRKQTLLGKKKDLNSIEKAFINFFYMLEKKGKESRQKELDAFDYAKKIARSIPIEEKAPEFMKKLKGSKSRFDILKRTFKNRKLLYKSIKEGS